MVNKLRFGVIGCGRMGLRRAKTICDHPETELIWLADNDEEKATGLGRDMQCECYASYREALSRTDVDCVIVSVPNKFHLPVVTFALEQGKHVWCEKPLARNPDEAMEMVKAAIKSDGFLKVGSNLRFFPSVQKAKKLLDSSVIGDILFLRGWIGNAGWETKSWFTNRDMAGGGTFLDNGSHLLDIYRWFLEEAIECIGYTSTTYWPVSPLEDSGMGIFKFVNQKMGYIHSSWTEWDEYMYMEIYGREGFIRIDDRGPHCATILGKKDGYREVFDYSRQPQQSYVWEFNEYVSAIRSNQQPLPSGFDGLRAVQMAFGVYESSRLGRRVTIWGKVEEELSQAFQRY